jgi:hypothetical protein
MEEEGNVLPIPSLLPMGQWTHQRWRLYDPGLVCHPVETDRYWIFGWNTIVDLRRAQRKDCFP